MNAKKWIKTWFLVPIVLIFISLLLIKETNIPLRFSNSISYDVKLAFIRNHQLLKNCNTIVAGSSMSLNNINGEFLEKNSKKINKVANIGSWGLKASEVFQLVSLIKLDKVKYLIYSTQYLDFDQYRLKDLNEREIKRYLEHKFTIYPYTKTLESLATNIKTYMKYKEKFENPNKYTYLGFDKTGSVNFTFGKKYINKIRWKKEYGHRYKLSKKSFYALIKLNELAKEKNIKFIVITTPMRKAIFKRDGAAKRVFDRYTERLESLSQKYHFAYLNMHKILNLNDSYFVDPEHLNKKGATLVSDEIVKYLATNR